MYEICDVASPSHVGSVPDQNPFAWQILRSTPLRLKPGLQEYVAVAPIDVPVIVTCPFGGLWSDSHIEAEDVKR